MNEILSKIESLLFVSGEPLSLKKIGEVLDIPPKEVRDAIDQLKSYLEEQKSGIRLLEHKNEFQLTSAPENAKAVEKLILAIKNESLTQASKEVLAIIGYMGPVHKHVIDEIRGVECSNVLKNLLLKGLVERREDPSDRRTHIYSLHTNTLRHLGISSQKDLPKFDEIKKQLSEVYDTKVSEKNEQDANPQELSKTEERDQEIANQAVGDAVNNLEQSNSEI